MRKLTGLSRQIVRSMAALALTIVLLVLLGSYAFYALLMAFSPTSMPSEDAWLPSGPELVWMALTILVALVLSITVAVKLSKRILLPLTSVADSLRQVANGDLDARASGDDDSMGEAARLVDDFNVMAERLQRMAKEQAFWNAAIAHELRTPVTILRGRLQGLAEGVFTPDGAQFQSLLTQVEGLSRLIEDLRVVGMFDSGHLSLLRQATDLSTDIETVVQLFEPRLRDAGLTPVLDLAPGKVDCDSARIRQALMALLENTRRHAVPGALHIRLHMHDNLCTLSVEDDGPGIAPELTERLFEAFQRGDPSRTRDTTGSGLGLAVVRAIAAAHCGQASCRASGKGGTVFELNWPI
ncbi:HAMP domain-containing histidine kinase [Pusillimonas caeni]|uniref:ATP-binding protein n=1 Tax=Pusillimonas caeni TaxID=1348472 RepID=UPI000E5A0C50|nr:ATP-binding protein [Pusillimonas caeni]TFL15324.1 HAMP domain-containing histidine kinase [Pusillimonas caeni]